MEETNVILNSLLRIVPAMYFLLVYPPVFLFTKKIIFGHFVDKTQDRKWQTDWQE